jgi:hypothetical protein
MIDYIDKNPEKAGIVKRVDGWAFGGIQQYAL